jgi:DNA-nicking Smr family endonuclease
VQSLDLHPIFRSNRDIDNALRTFLVRAASTGETTVEIIPGKGSGQLRQRVLTYLRQPHVRKLYRSVEADGPNTGRVVVHLR